MLKKLGWFFGTIILVCYSCFGYAGPSFVVAPTRLVFDLRHPQTQEVILKNTGDQLIHLTIKPVFYPINSKLLNLGQALQPKKETLYSLAPYILYSPHVVSLQPGEQRDVRIMAEVPMHVKEGEYRAHLLVHMIEAAHLRSRVTAATDTRKIGIDIKMLMQIAVPVYGNFGDGKAKLILHCSRNSQGFLQLNVVNKSPWHFDGDVEIAKLGDKNVIETQPLVLMRESKRTLILRMKPEANQTYQIKWQPTDAGFGISGDIKCKVK